VPPGPSVEPRLGNAVTCAKFGLHPLGGFGSDGSQRLKARYLFTPNGRPIADNNGKRHKIC
jgi:hypothetical protein